MKMVSQVQEAQDLHFLDKVLGYNLSSLEVLEFQVVLHSLLTLLLKWL
jgi:hypothetical protein